MVKLYVRNIFNFMDIHLVCCLLTMVVVLRFLLLFFFCISVILRMISFGLDYHWALKDSHFGHKVLNY